MNHRRHPEAPRPATNATSLSVSEARAMLSDRRSRLLDAVIAGGLLGIPMAEVFG